ncbi:GNAT family N-acetyltransferase [Paenibacillus assamensis]|uniref:GNAT family N-acetyltransferase n=1 Tax=Paenibacillus assamensis TaxID=311244 RepID=UPI000684DD1E|nr:GNAT family N-acetyltransferase [Paenibacillus assamensis]
MKIHTDRLELVPIDIAHSHTPIFAQYMNNKKHIHLYIKQLINDPDLLGWGVWLVISKDANVVIGDIGFKGKPVKETVEVGYGFMPGARNKGYATNKSHGYNDLLEINPLNLISYSAVIFCLNIT